MDRHPFENALQGFRLLISQAAPPHGVHELILQDDPALYSDRGGLSPIVRAQFAEDTLHVIHNGVLCYA